MNSEQIFWLCGLVGVLGVGTGIGLYFFGRYIFDKQISDLLTNLEEQTLVNLARGDVSPRPFRELLESFRDYLERRNEFWTLYGQISLAALIIIVLVILLLADKISPEAGLPILSGIAGFVLSKIGGIPGRPNPPSQDLGPDARQATPEE